MAFLVLDLIVLAILVLFAVQGAKRGLVRTLCSLLAAVVAFAGASIAARTLSPIVAQALEPKIAAVIEERLDEAIRHTEFISPEAAGGVASTPEEVPLGGVLDTLRDMGLYENLVGKVEQAVSQGLSAAAASAAAAAAAAVAQSAAYQIIFLVSFLLIRFLWRLFSRTLNLAVKLPGLHFLNKTLGAVFGLAQAVILLFILAWLLQFFGTLIPRETVEQTCLLRFFMDTNPLALLGAPK